MDSVEVVVMGGFADGTVDCTAGLASFQGDKFAWEKLVNIAAPSDGQYLVKLFLSRGFLIMLPRSFSICFLIQI